MGEACPPAPRAPRCEAGVCLRRAGPGPRAAPEETAYGAVRAAGCCVTVWTAFCGHGRRLGATHANSRAHAGCVASSTFRGGGHAQPGGASVPGTDPVRCRPPWLPLAAAAAREDVPGSQRGCTAIAAAQPPAARSAQPPRRGASGTRQRFMGGWGGGGGDVRRAAGAPGTTWQCLGLLAPRGEGAGTRAWLGPIKMPSPDETAHTPKQAPPEAAARLGAACAVGGV